VKDGPRRRALLGLTIGVILWPIVHLGLVARAGIDAWELFGWAMYSRPEARVQVRVDVERGGTREPLRAMGALRRQIERYARDRSTLGRLASPADLLEAVFASDASIEAIELVRRRVELDRGTAMLVAQEEHERYLRPSSTPGGAPDPD
jgi:hypothetical protein